MTATPPWSKFLSIDEVLHLYREGVRRYGGSFSAPKQDCLEGALGNAWTAVVYGNDAAMEQQISFAAFCLSYLIRSHCFVDGNKRVGWLAAMLILLKSGNTVHCSEAEGLQLCLSIASGAAPSSEVLQWVRHRVAPLE